ncbi:MAG: ECF transporter S component [Clostridia bacterium]|nr:ECF transporter S component [Clostridia bacterium]
MHQQSKATQFIVFAGVLSALSAILYFFEFPLIPGVAFLKVDLSDWPAAVAGVMLGPAAAVAVELIKTIIHVCTRGFGDTMGFGDLINFIVGVALTVPLSAVLRASLKRGRSRWLSVLLAGAAGMAAMALAGVAANYLIAPPYFQFFLHVKLTSAILWTEIGSATVLNVAKSVIIAALMAPVIALGKKRLILFPA